MLSEWCAPEQSIRGDASLAAALGGCAYKLPPYDYAREPDPRKDEFKVGPSDVLRVTVWRNPDLSGDAIVRPDGTISLPLIGDLRAAGRTPTEIRTDIANRLKAYIKDESATVTVAISVLNSYRFVVSGNVEHPGAFAANHFVTVSEAIAMTGGPNRFSSPVETVIIRADASGRPAASRSTIRRSSTASTRSTTCRCCRATWSTFRKSAG
jgi:polysaccharide export outer membrane protein